MVILSRCSGGNYFRNGLRCVNGKVRITAQTLWGHGKGLIKVSKGAIKSIFKKSGPKSVQR